MSEEILAELGDGGSVDRLQPGGGYSAIVAPPGVYLAGPDPDTEGLIAADLDFDLIADAKMIVDSAGHYARPDVVRLVLDRGRPRPLVVEDASDDHPNDEAAPE
jgi:predicted amidohydrolase